MKIVTIVGARPQFIKAAPVSRAIAEHNKVVTSESSLVKEVILHTGQHYDDNMSEVFFRDLELPKPDENLGVGSGSHGWQTGEMLIRIEEVLLAEEPDWVLVYGDTNSTLAGALAASKLGIPVAHIEAGLRSFNRQMPEEHNRVLTDHLSSLLFCPTRTAVNNLKREGLIQGVHLVGDVMYDSLLHNIELAERKSGLLERLKLKPKTYVLATVHRAENTDEPKQLRSIFLGLQQIAQHGLSVVVPLHPRTRKQLDSLDLTLAGLRSIDPASYLDMLVLEKHAKIILTDSGGVQKEAYWLKVPCVTLRKETEWVETLEAGWNVLAACEPDRMLTAVKEAKPGTGSQDLFGNGHAADILVSLLSSFEHIFSAERSDTAYRKTYP